MRKTQRNFERRMKKILNEIITSGFASPLDSEGIQVIVTCVKQGYLDGIENVSKNAAGNYSFDVVNPTVTYAGLQFLSRRKNAIVKYCFDNWIALLALVIATISLLLSISTL